MKQADLTFTQSYAERMANPIHEQQTQQESDSTQQTQNALIPVDPQIYYRSRIFTPLGGENTLASSASVLLSLLHRLRKNQHFGDAFELQHHLLHEIQVFETLAQQKGCNPESIRIARYLLCTTIDEILLAAAWNEQNIWEQERLASRFEEDKDELDGGERFFLILDRLMENPQRHIELLELIYICLSLGFEGKYQRLPEGQTRLDEINERLFLQLTQVRGEEAQPLMPKIQTLELTRLRKPTPLLAVGLSTAILSCCYFAFNYMLSIRAMPLAQTLETIVQHIQPFTL